MTIKELKENKGYYVHHVASRRGYLSRKDNGVVEQYDGKFGKGYLLLSPRWDTTRYVCVTYYIER